MVADLRQSGALEDRRTDPTPEAIAKIAQVLTSAWAAYLRETPTAQLCVDILTALDGAPPEELAGKLETMLRTKQTKVRSMGLALKLAMQVAGSWRDAVAGWVATAKRNGFSTELEFVQSVVEAMNAGRAAERGYPRQLQHWASRRLNELSKSAGDETGEEPKAKGAGGLERTFLTPEYLPNAESPGSLFCYRVVPIGDSRIRARAAPLVEQCGILATGPNRKWVS